MQNRSVRRLLAAALGFSLVLTGCSNGGDAVQTDAQVELGTAVEVQQLQRTSIRNELTYIGQIEPQVTISVASRLSAEVMAVNFEVGDYVNEGDVLFTVDAKDIQDQIRTLEASAASTQLAVEQAEYGLEVAQEGSAQERLNELQYETAINSARYATRSAEDARSNAKDGVDMAKDLLDAADYAVSAAQSVLNEMLTIEAVENEETGIMEYIWDKRPYNTVEWDSMIKRQQDTIRSAQQDAYSAEMGVDSAKSARDSTRIAVNQADSSFDLALESYEVYQDLADESRERSVRQAEFGVQTAQAAQNATQVQLSIAQSTLGYAQVTSPISGVVSARNIETGQMIGQATLPYTIIKMDTVNVQVNVSEMLINSIQVGDEVSVVIQSIREEPFTGQVYAVSPAAGASSTYPVWVELANPDGVIKPGMFSQVSFVQDQKDNTFVVDKSVVLKDETTEFVYVVENGLAKKVVVTTGLSNGTSVEILSGVGIGDDIVVVGQEYLQDGTAVNVVKREDGQPASQPPAAEVSDDEEAGDTEDAGEQDEQEDGEAPLQ